MNMALVWGSQIPLEWMSLGTQKYCETDIYQPSGKDCFLIIPPETRMCLNLIYLQPISAYLFSLQYYQSVTQVIEKRVRKLLCCPLWFGKGFAIILVISVFSLCTFNFYYQPSD